MKVTSLALLGTAAIPLALGAYVGSRPAAPAAAIPSITLTATDYAVHAPDTLPAGPVTLRLLNQGKACLISSKDGVSHLMKGMIRQATVVETAAPAKEPVGDVRMTLHDYGFILSEPLRAGRRIIEVRNEASQVHEIELIRLAPGKSAQDVMSWLKNRRGPPPGLPLGGIAPLERRQVSWFEVDLQPTRYLLICFVPDEKDGRPHYKHGMIQEIDVGSALSSSE